MHNGFVRVDDEKMSKSLGNFFTIREILKVFDAEVVRFFILRAHYRSPLNYSDTHMNDARLALTRLYTALKGVPPGAVDVDWSLPHAQRFKAALDDDFGTPEAVAVLFEMANEANRGNPALAVQLRALGGVLGLLQRDPQEFLQSGPAQAGGGQLEAEIAERIQARLDAPRRRTTRPTASGNAGLRPACCSCGPGGTAGACLGICPWAYSVSVRTARNAPGSRSREMNLNPPPGRRPGQWRKLPSADDGRSTWSCHCGCSAKLRT
jgi:hypothetical protein